MPAIRMTSRTGPQRGPVSALSEAYGRERRQVVGSCEGAAIFGVRTILCPGIQRLMRDAQHGAFNVLLAEGLDRISRDQADTVRLSKQLKVAGVTSDIAKAGRLKSLALVRKIRLHSEADSRKAAVALEKGIGKILAKSARPVATPIKWPSGYA